MKKIQNLFLLPLRKNSKRIVDKNIRLIGHKPLFTYQLECALSVDCEKLVVVASDSSEYLDLAKQHEGVEALERPDFTSTDGSKVENTMRYVIEAYAEQDICFENIVLFQATNPLNEKKWVEEGLSLMQEGGINSVVTYADFDRFFLDSEDLIDRPMTQNKQKQMLETGCFWITKVSAFLEHGNRIIEPFGKVKVSKYAGLLDIDDEEDLKLAEALLKPKYFEYYKHRKEDQTIDYTNYWAEKVDPDGVTRNTLEEKEGKIEFCKEEIDYINSRPNKHGQKILDLGCGPGFISSAFSDEYKKYGLEVSDSAIEEAKKYIDNIHFGELDANTYEDNFFDIIFCSHVIEHVKDPIDFIKKTAKITKVHGELIISTPNFDCAMARRYGEKFRMYNDPTHITFFSDLTLREALEDYGFYVERTEYPYFDTKYFNQESLGKLFDSSAKTSPPFYGNIMTLYCKKK
jgi:CMP-N-acetylneuraminic acid synthetase/ubiquinone/menaquinone biosynthesis C-methylase UbiE